MKTPILLLLALSLSFNGLAQLPEIGESGNLVPNPGFERFSASPIGWFYKGEHFTRVMKFWSAATGASPDVFGPKVRVPESWAEKGFGKQAPHSGGAMAGITVYGCEDGKPHCREFIQIQLIEPLVIGQQYYVEMWVSNLPRSLQINNLGFFFSETSFQQVTDEPIDVDPQVYATDIIDTKEDQWTRVSGNFTAATEAEFLLIGNFFSDKETQVKAVEDDSFKFAYFYIDDVELRKVPPILPIPIKEDDLTLVELELGKIITLQDLYFEFDKWELHPRSNVELQKLVQIMEANPTMKIQINGHTDDWGTTQYNMYLSRKRAKAVIDYLSENGISPTRTLYKAFGESMPVAPNDSSEGRQLNRRVDFTILSL
ncbi:MAG: OmpA family protein [Saprospiraceae bacterium]|nr:OmpA family protein [Saprospiraceae bacterium]